MKKIILHHFITKQINVQKSIFVYLDTFELSVLLNI